MRRSELCKPLSRAFAWAAALGLTVVAACVPPPATAAACPQLVGWVEPVTVAGRMMEAKLDTGAQTSSVDAQDIRHFGREGRPWVQFRLGPRRNNPAKTSQGSGRETTDDAMIEAPVVRRTHIKRAGAPTERRLVVTLPMCLAGVSAETEFTLSNRVALEYRVLIGRAALGQLAIDATRTHVTVGSCPAGVAKTAR